VEDTVNEMERHIGDEVLQGYLEGTLRGDVRETVEKHLESCTRCAESLSEWRVLFASIEALPPVEAGPTFRTRVLKGVREAVDPVDAALDSLAAFAPSPEFSRKVMREVRGDVRHDARQTTRGDVRAGGRARGRSWKAAHLLDWLLPSSSRGWALAGGLVVAPAFGILVVLGALLLHPLLGPGEVIAFVGRQAASVFQSGLLRAVAMVSQSPISLPVQGLIQTLIDAPGTAATAILAAWGSTAAAGWILYRNLFTDPPGSRPHVQAP